MTADIDSLLSAPVGISTVRRVVALTAEAGDCTGLLELAMSANDRLAKNALWALTHLQPLLPSRFQEIQNQLIDLLLQETETSKKRMLLQILRKTDFDPTEPRADFIDYCFSKINSECEPYAVRANCIHIAFKLCCGYGELLDELSAHLEMLSFQPLSPGLKSALRQTQLRIARLNRRNSGAKHGDRN